MTPSAQISFPDLPIAACMQRVGSMQYAARMDGFFAQGHTGIFYYTHAFIARSQHLSFVQLVEAVYL